MLCTGRDGLRAPSYLFKHLEAVFVLEDLRVMVMWEGSPSAWAAAAPLNLRARPEKVRLGRGGAYEKKKQVSSR